MGDLPFGVKQRAPTPSEMSFFKRSEIPGYAADDGFVVLSPSPAPNVNTEAVARNEAARVFMRQNKDFSPNFKLTPAQESFLNGTEYARASTAQRRETIAARIFSGDPSAQQPTEEQLGFVRRLSAASKGSLMSRAKK